MRLAVDAGGGEQRRADASRSAGTGSVRRCLPLVYLLGGRAGCQDGCAIRRCVERYLVSICRTSSACVAVARCERTTGTTVTVTWSRPSPSRARRASVHSSTREAGTSWCGRRRSKAVTGPRTSQCPCSVLAEATAVTEHGERPDVAGGAFQRSVRRRIRGVEEDPRSYDGPLWSRP